MGKKAADNLVFHLSILLCSGCLVLPVLCVGDVSLSSLELLRLDSGNRTDYLDASVNGHTGHTLRSQYSSSDPNEAPRSVEVTIDGKLAVTWISASNITEFSGPLNKENARFDHFQSNRTLDLTFVKPSVFMKGLYKFNINFTSGAFASKERYIFTFSNCSKPYTTSVNSTDCQITIIIGCQGHLFPEPLVHESIIVASNDKNDSNNNDNNNNNSSINDEITVESFQFDKGPVDDQTGTFRFFSKGVYNVTDSSPKTLVHRFRFVHTAAANVGGIEASGTATINGFRHAGCTDWRPFCSSGNASDLPQLSRNSYLDPNLDCTVANARDSTLDKCRRELVPDVAKDPAVLTFNCADNCTMVWNGTLSNDNNRTSKVLTCGADDLEWQDPEMEFEGILPICYCRHLHSAGSSHGLSFVSSAFLLVSFMTAKAFIL